MKQDLSQLAELADAIRRIMPPSPPISNLRIDEEAGLINFGWQARQFAVDRRLRVFELKGKRLFVTGSSVLIHSVLHRRDKNQKVIEAVQEALSEVTSLIDSRQRVESGLKLLQSARDALQKLIIGKPVARPKPSAPNLAPGL